MDHITDLRLIDDLRLEGCDEYREDDMGGTWSFPCGLSLTEDYMNAVGGSYEDSEIRVLREMHRTHHYAGHPNQKFYSGIVWVENHLIVRAECAH